MGDKYHMTSDQILLLDRFVSTPRGYRRFEYFFDFEFRVMTMSGQEGRSGVVPFSALDEKMLEDMHAKLTALGGNPRPLEDAPGKPSLRPPAKGNGLNL